MKKLYILGRSKREKPAAERLRTLYSSKLFDRLRLIDEQFFDRIQIVEGDMQSIGVGISAVDRQQLIVNVQIVVHLAANVHFDSPIAEICLMNIRGTRDILALAKQIEHLIAFAYMSTAYSHCCYDRVEEKFYPAPIDPDQMIRVLEHLEHDTSNCLNVITDKLIKPWPNTYSFSKAIAEELLRRSAMDLPIVVIRPSISK